MANTAYDNEPALDETADECETRIENIVSRGLTDAIDYIDNEVGPARAEATRYYNGEPFGDEEEGRSRVISRDVRDTIQSLMPSIMRVFFGGEKVVEFIPRGPEDIELAAQQTAFINDVVVQQDNEGFLQIHSGIKDALVRKVGVWKWWWDDRTQLKVSTVTGQSEAAIRLLQEDPDIEEVEVEVTSPKGVKPVVYKAAIHRRITDGRAQFMAVPSDEFLIDRRARSIKDATFVAHRAELTVSDLVAMGYDREDVMAGVGYGSELDTEERQARNPLRTVYGGDDDSSNPDMRRALYTEAYTYIRLSTDSSDPAQLVRVCGLRSGSSFTLLDYEPVDEIPFSAICPEPEPHTFFGLCPADMVMDIQRIKSAIQRGTLDSLSLSIHPRYEAVDDNVNLMDLANSEIGGIVRVRAPGQLREIQLPFVGANTLPMLEYYDSVKESRTKQSQASQGLDADALQSSTKAAVSATISAAQAQIELISRIFAETGVRDLYRGLYRLIAKNQDKPRMVRLRGKYVEVDPRDWTAEMDVRVNVALGAGSSDEKLAVLAGISEKQEQIMAAVPGNPMVGFPELRNTYARMVELSGWTDATQFFKEVPPDYQPPAPPDDDGGGDADKLAQAQMAETKARAQTEQAKLAMERHKIEVEDARERYRIMLDSQTKIAIAEAQTSTDIDEMHINAVVAKMQAQQEAATRMHEAQVAAQARPTPNTTDGPTQ